VAWLSRPAAVARWGRSTALARDPGSAWSIELDLVALLETMAVARSPRAAARARAALETVWAAGPPHRAEIWTVIWWWVGDRRRDHIEPALPTAVMRFLLDPDPESPHEPRIRLVTGLSLRTWRLSGNEVEGEVVEMARSAPDLQIRRELADVLSRTDQPALLNALLRAFAGGLNFLPGLGNGGRYYYLLWGEDGSPLRTAMLTNPHLLPHLRAAASDDGTRRALVVLLAPAEPGRPPRRARRTVRGLDTAGQRGWCHRRAGAPRRCLPAGTACVAPGCGPRGGLRPRAGAPQWCDAGSRCRGDRRGLPAG